MPHYLQSFIIIIIICSGRTKPVYVLFFVSHGRDFTKVGERVAFFVFFQTLATVTLTLVRSRSRSLMMKAKIVFGRADALS